MSNQFELYPPDFSYELRERIAIMEVDNDIDLHERHLENRAAKEIRERILTGSQDKKND